MSLSIFKKLEHWQQRSTEVRILIIGKTGTGKSSLINAVTGFKLAEEGDTLQPKTTKVTEYSNKAIGDIQLRVWDSPGLQDGTTNEKAYLEDITRKCKNVDLIIYCIRMSQARIIENGPDSIAMQKLSQESCLGPNMWHNTIIVLTFANLVAKKGMKYQEDKSPQGVQKFFQEEFKASKHAIKQRLIHDVGLSASFVDTIPIVVAGYHTTPELPDLTTSDGGSFFWLSDLWLKALSVTKLDAQPAMIKLNENRMVMDQQEYVGKAQMDTKQALMDQMPLMFAEKGAEIGCQISRFRIASMVGKYTGAAFGHYMSWSLLANQGVKNKILTEDEFTALTKGEGQASRSL